MARLAPTHGVRHAPVTVEEEYFPPPPELRELLRGLESALGVLNAVPSGLVGGDGSGGESVGAVLAGDRTTVAADVLERMAG